MCARLLQSYLSLCNPMDCSLPVSSGHGVLQVRISMFLISMKWVGCHFFSRGSSLCLWCLPALAGGFFATRATIFFFFSFFLFSFFFILKKISKWIHHRTIFYSVHELLFWKKKFFLTLFLNFFSMVTFKGVCGWGLRNTWEGLVIPVFDCV